MKTKRSTTRITSQRQRMSVSIRVAILLVAAITAILLVWQQSTALVPALVPIDTQPLLDQHERHPVDDPSNLSAPLGYPALYQREGRAASAPANLYRPLDQHERHPELFGASGGIEAGARDRWSAEREEDDPNAAGDAWWLDK